MKILFLAPFPPRIDGAHGGARVMAQFLYRLTTRHRVTLLYLRGPGEGPIDDTLRDHCEIAEEFARGPTADSRSAEIVSALDLWLGLVRGTPAWASEWWAPSLAERVREIARTWEPDIVQLEFHVMGRYLGALADSHARRVLTEHDPGAKAARQRLDAHLTPGRLMPYLDARAWQRFERAILRQVDAVVVFTERDRQAVEELTASTRVVRIPLGATLPEEPLDPLGVPDTLLFVGNFEHPPNVDAAVRLIRDILPLVRATRPEATLTIVGDHVSSEIRRLAGTAVVVTGRVPDVEPYLDRAAVVVVPLRLGGGMRVKVLEALAAGKAVVASPLAVEGLDVSDGEQVRLATTDQEFCQAIVRLLDDPAARAALAARARRWASENLDWETSVAAYEALYSSLARPAPGGP